MELSGLIGYAVFFLSTVSIYAILALGLNVQWGMTGQINIGIAGFFAVGAYTAAILTSAPNAAHVGGFELPFLVGIVAAVITSSIVALIIGAITVNLRSDYLAIATIGIAEIIRFTFQNEEWLSHGVRGIADIPRPFYEGKESGLVFLAVALVSVAIAYFLVERARVAPWGRVLRAIRDNEIATEAAGKDVRRFRLQAFVFGSALMGFAGALYAHFIGFISPDAFEPVFATFIVWAMLIAGGSGNNKGALLGAIVVWLVWSGTETLVARLPADMATQASAARVLLVGVLLEIVLLTRPQGILPEERPKLIARRKK
ncbi:branched-chain amino acid ABC transporter permease [Amorphus orientalis]|uniref:Branched-chain amino acid transport system permease protein n=1 Tax=Amorphus orientalis TaxID=649198 RepID=A0AAE4AT63_9HYPH|nr:branched-chain amino acid ABC transporter permease [Amorphus orientalis]MDQ0316961.1 branched-chain amino acid transport system permease protein [Amorphus orientalis]